MLPHALTHRAFTGTGWTVGLNHGAHDASCALLKDGRLVVTVEQERLSRRKKALDESPAGALRYCLDFAGIDLKDIDAVALGSHHGELADWMGFDAAERARALPYDSPDWLFPADLFGGERRPPLVPVRHHLAHAASCFWPSGYEDAAVLVMDAMGEDCSTSIAVGGPDGLRILETHPVEQSLGFFYEAACEFVGLGRDSAGKLMGLAPYGRARFDVGLGYADHRIAWERVVNRGLVGRALIEDRIAQLVAGFEATCYPYERGCTEDVMAYADFAASVQQALEEVVLALARRARDLTGSDTLVIAGGVGLNCTVNGKLADSGLFRRVWVQPMAHDAGVALGAALAVAHKLGQDVAAPMGHAYWGPGGTDEEIALELKRNGLDARRLPEAELVSEAAALVASGRVLAWHQGRAEVGPRALGARSFVGDPRARRTLIRMNTIKRREMWRPLAPSVLADHFDDYFDGVPNDFMIVAASVREEIASRIPAVVHVDGSARPQAVRAETNRRYAALITEFHRLTGVPLVVNTSLNQADEPLCSSPADTIRTFLASGADALAIGSYLVVRGEDA
ncbi:carbamoyltransferase [Streptomyces sp. NRRL B-1381]|uniref:carbamoyltransferase family protein n=1 Tax=Streptomyces sp. NRRL B-1381 TaxID=1463829 RepID=UPI00067E5148|nr:carbamoyltransferase C-terminal domain-containing protein [Streptomyces sp. NRRL B-1381]